MPSLLRTLLSRPTLLATAALVAFFPAFRPCLADGAAPAKKDSPPFIRPKEVKLSATVEPIEAKPGETVVYRVSAKVSAGWHIYDYAKVPPADGPKTTDFDFFDKAGLVVDGDW